MKTIVKMILPVAAFVLASAGAISTNAKTESKTAAPLINGWIQNPNANSCEARTNLDCSTTNSGSVCMSSDATPKQVFLKNAAGQCSSNLYRVIH